jgi:phage terminase large subunit-like protein
MTRGQKVLKFIEKFCVVPEGLHVGKPVTLAQFQRDFILAIYDNPHGTDTAILSMARKNAKTATIGFLVLAHLVGPEARQNSRIVSGALSREQAAEVYNLASKCVMLSPKLSEIVRIIPSSKKLIGLPMNVEYQAISAEGKTAHGKSPVVAILDEVGQIRGPQSDFIDAITTAQGAYEDPLLIYISTQAASDGDLFSLLIDDALKNKPKKTVCHLYTSDKEDDISKPNTWRKANPAMGLFRSEDDLKKQADKAKRMPTFENTFRNLMLNQRVSTHSPFVSESVWLENAAPPEPIDGRNVYIGLDLSARSDMTAAVMVSRGDDGVFDVWPLFWTPRVGLHDRADKDKQPYALWAKDGDLLVTPGASVDYGFVVKELGGYHARCDIKAVGFDRWRIDVFEKEMDREGVNLPLEPFGQGFKDMAPAVDALEEALLSGKIRHGNHPVLSMCAQHAVIKKDPSGNRKFDKSIATQRIDGIVALAMALKLATMDAGGGNIDDFIDDPIRV